jgi:4a-hydroxytetrahydrobiopterin dehydratase
MTMVLTQKKCLPCKEGASCLTSSNINKLACEIKGWSVVENHHLLKSFKFNNFATALDYVNKVAKIAELEDHHPDICFGWGKVEIMLYTHAVNGLHENDFILAAKIDTILK